MRTKRQSARLERQAEELSAKYPPGTPCRFWRGAKEGPGTPGVIRSAYAVLGGHTVVVWVKGTTGCIAASHVEPEGGDVMPNPSELERQAESADPGPITEDLLRRVREAEGALARLLPIVRSYIKAPGQVRGEVYRELVATVQSLDGVPVDEGQTWANLLKRAESENQRLQAEVEKWRHAAAIALSGVKDGISVEDPEFSLCVLTDAMKAMEADRDRLREEVERLRGNATTTLAGLGDGNPTDDPVFALCCMATYWKGQADKILAVENDYRDQLANAREERDLAEGECERLRAALKASRPLKHETASGCDPRQAWMRLEDSSCAPDCPGCESERLRKEVLGE